MSVDHSSIFEKIRGQASLIRSHAEQLLSDCTLDELIEEMARYRSQHDPDATGSLSILTSDGSYSREVEPRQAITLPPARTLNDMPSLVRSRAGKTFDVPAVKLVSFAAEPVYVSFAEAIPVALTKRSRKEYSIIPEISSSYAYVHNLLDWRARIESNQIEVDNAFIIHDHFGGNNYAHWLLDWLPRLHVALHHTGVPLHQLRFISPMPLNRSQRESLDCLGIDPSQVIRLRRPTLTEAPTFVCTNLWGCSTSGTDLRRPAQIGSSWALDFVRSLFLKKESTERKRLIIKRKGTRQLHLSDKSNALLEKYGFESLYMEDLSIKDQAKAFNSAAVIIAAHGAGLSNLVFCQPGTSVLEIFPPEYSTGNLFTIAAMRQLEYTCVVGKQIERADAKHIRDHDIYLDDDLLNEFVMGAL